MKKNFFYTKEIMFAKNITLNNLSKFQESLVRLVSDELTDYAMMNEVLSQDYINDPRFSINVCQENNKIKIEISLEDIIDDIHINDSLFTIELLKSFKSVWSQDIIKIESDITESKIDERFKNLLDFVSPSITELNIKEIPKSYEKLSTLLDAYCNVFDKFLSYLEKKHKESEFLKENYSEPESILILNKEYDAFIDKVASSYDDIILPDVLKRRRDKKILREDFYQKLKLFMGLDIESKLKFGENLEKEKNDKKSNNSDQILLTDY